VRINPHDGAETGRCHGKSVWIHRLGNTAGLDVELPVNWINDDRPHCTPGLNRPRNQGECGGIEHKDWIISCATLRAYPDPPEQAIEGSFSGTEAYRIGRNLGIRAARKGQHLPTGQIPRPEIVVLQVYVHAVAVAYSRQDGQSIPVNNRQSTS
jgi:hypothetical protein